MHAAGAGGADARALRRLDLDPSMLALGERVALVEREMPDDLAADGPAPRSGVGGRREEENGGDEEEHGPGLSRQARAAASCAWIVAPALDSGQKPR